MEIIKKFNDISELQTVQRIACGSDGDVFLTDLENTVRVDAKSFINLFTLDLSRPVRIVTESHVTGLKLQQI